jgi:SP family sugar:H+ symporter-like MFS transporter
MTELGLQLSDTEAVNGTSPLLLDAETGGSPAKHKAKAVNIFEFTSPAKSFASFSTAASEEDSLVETTVTQSLSDDGRAGLGKSMVQPNARMFVAISTVMIGAIMFGIDCGNFGSVQGFDSFHRDWCVGHYGNNVTCGDSRIHGAATNKRWMSDFVTWASVLVFAGAGAGSLLLGPIISNRFGRQPCISIGALMCFAGCLVTTYLSFEKVQVFFVGRFVTGFGIGVCCFALPLYNSEVSAPSVRGATGSLIQVNVVLGTVVSSIFTYFDRDWRHGMMLEGAVAMIVAIGVWCVPESPRYVMAKCGFEAGSLTLGMVRSGDIKAEAMEMKGSLLAEEKAGQVQYSDILRNRNLRTRVLIACWLQFASQFTGMNALLMFSAMLFTELGFDDPFAPNMMFTALQLAGVIVGLLMLDSKVGGRRFQLILVTAIIIPALILLGVAAAMAWSNIIELLLVCLFSFVWQIAWGMIPWVYPSELFTMAEKDRATSLAVFVQYTANALLMIVVPKLQVAIGLPGLLWFFGCFNIFNLIFVLSCIKETKGVPLQDVPALFGATSSETLAP